MALIFPVGLLIVQLCGAELYTANTAFVSGHAVVGMRGLNEPLWLMNEGLLQNQLLRVQGLLTMPLPGRICELRQLLAHMFVPCAHTCLCCVGSNVGEVFVLHWSAKSGRLKLWLTSLHAQPPSFPGHSCRAGGQGNGGATCKELVLELHR